MFDRNLARNVQWMVIFIVLIVALLFGTGMYFLGAYNGKDNLRADQAEAQSDVSAKSFRKQQSDRLSVDRSSEELKEQRSQYAIYISNDLDSQRWADVLLSRCVSHLSAGPGLRPEAYCTVPARPDVDQESRDTGGGEDQRRVANSVD